MTQKRSNDSKNHSGLTSGILIFLVLLGWGLLTISYFSSYSYMFPHVPEVSLFISKTLVNICIPLLLIGVCVTLVLKKRTAAFLVCYIVTIVCLGGCFMRSSAEVLFSPTVCSYTSDPSQFGKFDSNIGLNMAHIKSFPEYIPESAKDPQYTYFFEKASADTVYIAVSWCYEEDEEIQDFFSSYQETDFFVNQFGEMVYYDPNWKNEALDVHPYLYSITLLDKRAKCVAFVVASSAEFLPQSLAEVFELPI